MKKSLKIIISFLLFTCFTSFVNANCNDDDLNEWATKVETVFTENTVTTGSISKYAYFLSINPMREDVVIVVSDEFGNKANGETFSELNLYGVGAYTNLEEETYKIEVYGDKNSACSGELLKTLSYTVPRFNRRIKDARCANNSDLEICKTFTNSTKDMTEEDFNKEISKHVKEKESTTSKILSAVVGYGLFILVPIIVIGFIYMSKINKVKKEERNR